MKIVLAVVTMYVPCWAQETMDTRKQEIVSKLDGQRVSLDFKEAPLEDVVNFLRELTGINFFIDPDIHTKFTEEQRRVSFRAKDLRLRSALKFILEGKGLAAVYREGVLVLTLKEKAQGKVALEMYDVRDLLFKLQDFPGPKVELSGGGSTPVVTGVFDYGGEPKSVITEDFIVDLVKGNTGDRSWEENPNVSISLANGLLVVTQTRKAHEEIRRLLNLLRQYK